MTFPPLSPQEPTEEEKRRERMRQLREAAGLPTAEPPQVYTPRASVAQAVGANDPRRRIAQDLGITLGQDDAAYSASRTPLEEASGESYGDSFGAKALRVGAAVGKEFVRSVNVFEVDIPARERAYRIANVAAFALPFGATAKLGAYAPKLLGPLVATRARRIALAAAETGAVTAGLEAVRGEPTVATGIFGAAVGGAIEASFGIVGRTVNRARAAAMRPLFDDVARLLDKNVTPLNSAQYAIFVPSRADLPPAANVVRLGELVGKLADEGYDTQLLKYGAKKLDAVLVPGLSDEAAVRLAHNLREESVITSGFGYVDLKRGSAAAMKRSGFKSGSAINPVYDHWFERATPGGPARFALAFDDANWLPLGESVRRTNPAVAERVESLIARRDPSFFERMRDKDSATLISKLYQATVRSISGLERTQKELMGLTGRALRALPFGSNWGELVQWAQGSWSSYTQGGVLNSLRALDDPGKVLGPALKKIWSEVGADEFNAFERYGFARRWLSNYGTHPEGERMLPIDPLTSTRLTVDELHELVDDAPQNFAKAFDATVVWENTWLYETLVKSGIISEEQFRLIVTLSEDYIPMIRAMDELAARGVAGETEDFFLFADPIKHLTEAKGQYLPWTQQIIKRAFMFSRMAHQAKAVGSILDDFAKFAPEHLAGIAERVEGPPLRLTQRTKQIVAALGDTDPGLARALAAFDEATTTIIAEPGTALSTQGYIRRLVNGAPEWWRVNDESVWKGIEFLTPQERGLYVKLHTPPASMLRAGATLSLGFLARNPVRDFFTAFVNIGLNPMQAARGFASLLRMDEFYEQWVSGGGLRATLVSLDRDVLPQVVDQLADAAPLSLNGLVRSPFEALRALSEFMEAGTRLGVYRKVSGDVLESSGDALEAIRKGVMMSRTTTTDFSVHGFATGGIRLTTAFWNANVQGVDTFLRFARDDPAGVLRRATLGITLPSVLLYLHNRRYRDEYFNLPEWERNVFWHVRVPDAMAEFLGDAADKLPSSQRFAVSPEQPKWLRIPKPFEPGIIFGSLVERFAEAVDREDPSVLDDFARDQLRGNAFTLAPLPTAWVPLLELLHGRSFFFDRPIEPRALEEVAAQFRTQQGTSDVAEAMGRFLGVSPLKLEHLMLGYSAGLGRMVTDVGDYALRLGEAAKDFALEGEPSLPAKPALTLGDVPLVRGFVSRYPTNARSTEEFYKLYERSREATRTASWLERSLAVDDYSDWVLQSAELIGMAKPLESIATQIRELRARRYAILDDVGMSALAKREAINVLDEQTTQLTSALMEALRGIQP